MIVATRAKFIQSGIGDGSGQLPGIDGFVALELHLEFTLRWVPVSAIAGPS